MDRKHRTVPQETNIWFQCEMLDNQFNMCIIVTMVMNVSILSLTAVFMVQYQQNHHQIHLFTFTFLIYPLPLITLHYS